MFIKSTISLCLLLVVSFWTVSCHKLPRLFSKKSSLETEEDKKFYTMGYLLGKNVKKMESSLKTEAFLEGIKDSLNDKDPRVKQNQFFNQKKNTKKEGEKYKMEGKKFLEENSKKPEVKVTSSGLQYKVLKEGTGDKPQATDTVEVHYRGTLIDGTEFDSSYKRNKSLSFPLNRVIKGWTEGVQLMKKGAKYQFFIPSELGYGSQGAGEAIPPHATLIFEVELLNIL